MRVRVRYAKAGKLRFVSAIDLGRLWERALRKAELPIAYSEGFSPHPKVSFPDALPLGYASTGEYAELTFAAPVVLDPAVKALNAAFPTGVEVLAAVVVNDGDPRLAKWLHASTWDVRYPPELEPDELRGGIAAALAAPTLPVARERKGDAVQIDLRPAVHQLSLSNPHPPSGEVVLRATLHHVEPPVRPTEVHQALQMTADRPLPEPVLVTRVAQGRADPLGLREALSDELVPALDAVSDPHRDRTSRARDEHRHHE